MKKPQFSGLNNEEVRERKSAGLYNKSVEAPSKTVKEIVLSNLITYFNIVFFVLAIILVLAGSVRSLTFLPAVIFNTVVGIAQELRAKSVLDKLKVLHSPKARVVRAGKEKIVSTEDLVLDDVVIFKAGDEIPADAKILSGEVAVNEALLTGEADEIIKIKDDELMSGSFVVYGECYAKLTKVGRSSYAAQLTLKAKAIKKGEQSEIIRSLNSYIKVIGITIIPIGIILFVQQFFFHHQTILMSVKPATAAIISMIPEGLFLLSTVTLAVSATRLATKKVMLHDMKSIETLARVDMLCVDKTGTITTDKMEVVKTVWLGDELEIEVDGKSVSRESLLPSMIGEVVANLSAENATMAALKAKFKRVRGFKLDDYENFVGAIPFSSKYKYSGVQFENAAFVIGAPEFVMRGEYDLVRKEVKKYANEGYRVLIFGKYNSKLVLNSSDRALTAKVIPLGLIVLENEIRDTAAETFKYFAEQGVEIKVISGDDPLTVSKVAKKVGILNAEKAVDVTKLGSGKDFEKAVQENVVLGRVTPAQKRRIVKILKAAGHTVAMTGDGVNDVLALKDADCSVAMASGAQAAVQASQVVLLESDFSKMPEVVTEGRRVVNNLERSGSLFIVKNIFSLIMALLSICFSVTYPMDPEQVSLITTFTIGLPSFFLAMIPNHNLIRGNFLKNIIFTAAPTAIANVVLIGLTTMVCGFMGMERPAASTIAILIWAVVGSVHLFNISRPFNKIKMAIFFVCIASMVISAMIMPWLFGLNLVFEFREWVVLIVAILAVYPAMRLSEKFIKWLDVTFYDKYIEKFVKKVNKIEKKIRI